MFVRSPLGRARSGIELDDELLIDGQRDLFAHRVGEHRADLVPRVERQPGRDRARLDRLQRQIEQYKEDNQQLREALARAERTLQMDQAAYLELDQSLKDSARQIVKLREELNFYRNIISPANKKSGLRIQSLNIELEGKDNNLYKYKLVLIQALNHEQTIRGKVKFEVMGLQVGENAVLQFPDSKAKSINVSFKYFQDIEGQIELPRNFEPHKIKVNVITRGRGAQTIEQVYAWPKFNGKA